MYCIIKKDLAITSLMGSMVGMNLKSWRKSKRMTQQQLADALGVRKGAVARYESGTRTPSNKIMPLVIELTAAKVKPNDFYRDLLAKFKK